MLKLREKLLVEKCINNILRDHTISLESVKNNSPYNVYDNDKNIADIDLQLDFLNFLTSNYETEVKYGITYLQNNKHRFLEQFKILYPIILEYQTFGLNGQLQCLQIDQEKRREEIKKEQTQCKVTFNTVTGQVIVEKRKVDVENTKNNNLSFLKKLVEFIKSWGRNLV